MHERGCQTTPLASPDEIEWAFPVGQPSIVAHIPTGDGDYVAIRLDQTAPESHYEREHVRALLRIAERVMAESEPSALNALISHASKAAV